MVDDGCSAQFELDKLPKDKLEYYQYNFDVLNELGQFQTSNFACTECNSNNR